ncbi:acetylcholine receptor subunit alpha-1-B-like [Styela clava]
MMVRRIVQGFVIFVVISSVLGGSRNNITKDLMRNYDKRVRPAKGFSESVRVKFKLHLNQLLDVSEVSQKIETKLWLSHRWTDSRLEWNPDEYEGLQYVHLPTEDLWLPVFVLYNNADGDFAVTDFTKAKVYSNGTIDWKPPVIFSSFCEIQVANFPFDTQNCTMKIGPWTSGQDLLDMVNSDGEVMNHKCESPDIENYNENGEWKMLSTGCYKHYIQYTCCIGPYVDMTYHFVIQRRPLYLMMNILFPTMLFSLLTCTVFYLPSDAGEKMTLSVSLLLSLVVFLLVIVEAIPSTAKGVPLLGQYILFTMILVTLSIIITVFVLNVHYRTPSTHTMPDWVKKVFIVLLPKMMFSSTIKKMNPFADDEEMKSKKNFYNEISDISGSEGSDGRALLNPDTKEAIEGIQLVAEHFKDEEESYKEQIEWKYVAMVLDHFLLYVFIAAILLGTIGIFGKRLLELGYEEEMFRNNKDDCLLNCVA